MGSFTFVSCAWGDFILDFQNVHNKKLMSFILRSLDMMHSLTCSCYLVYVETHKREVQRIVWAHQG